ncbi:MAG TPA: DUF1266 domain-containing protein [Steroidobacteraceae bacterium]|nr:DUF1266 domain-containing protein [Steroidobacteraceae bacterium]
MIFEVNGSRHDLLAGTSLTPDGQERAKRLLSNGWSINDRADLLDRLTWLQFEGHRSAFEALGQQVDAMDEQEFMAAKAALLTSEQELQQLDVVRQNHRQLGQKGILAWDLIRYIALCRWGFRAGYMSEPEAWDYIMPAALRLQQTFTSWEDLQTDYLIGRKFWSAEQTEGIGNQFQAIYNKFIRHPASPWNVNPWVMDLGVTTPLPIAAN